MSYLEMFEQALAELDGDDILIRPRGSEPDPDPRVYRRAPRELWCERCRDLDARGVTTLLCSVCDVRTDDGA